MTWTGAPQTNAGSYPVTATIADTNYTGAASGTFVITKAAATVTLGGLTQGYTGSALTPTATTVPAGLAVTWTGAPQTNAGSYPVTATIADANYTGAASGTFVITKAAATVTLSGLTQGYTGSALTPTATTVPAGLAVTWTGAPQTNAGSYAVTATIADANYTGTASGTFVITKAAATVTLGGLTQGYTGSALTPTATTVPAGLAVTWTGAPQTNAGSYPVTATIADANYTGAASGTFVITQGGGDGDAERADAGLYGQRADADGDDGAGGPGGDVDGRAADERGELRGDGDDRRRELHGDGERHVRHHEGGGDGDARRADAGLHGQRADADGDDGAGGPRGDVDGGAADERGELPGDGDDRRRELHGGGERHVRHHEGGGDGDARAG